MVYEEWFDRYDIKRKPDGYVPEEEPKKSWWKCFSFKRISNKETGERGWMLTFRKEW